MDQSLIENNQYNQQNRSTDPVTIHPKYQLEPQTDTTASCKFQITIESDIQLCINYKGEEKQQKPSSLQQLFNLNPTQRLKYRLIQRLLKYSINSFSDRFRQNAQTSCSRAHMMRNKTQLNMDKRDSIRHLNISEAFLCFFISKTLKTSLVNQEDKKLITQFIVQMEQEIKVQDGKHMNSMLEDQQLKIYLQRTQCQTLYECLKQFKLCAQPKSISK